VCGICGLAALDGGPVDPAPLAAMSATLVHRGPDDEGSVVDGPVALAARRLAIIDLDGGRQPIASEDGRVHAALNGEILNHAELRRDLERAGHRFATRCDTEVLVHLYEDRGEAMLDALRGMFAFALWDARDRRLLLARDRFGIKPLYWRAARGVLSFASELKALRTQPGFDESLDHDAVEAYFAFNSIPSPMTIFREARKLEPGTLLTWSPRRDPAVRRWCRPAPVQAQDVRREDEAELASELADRLRDSVRAHLVSDVPIGVWLSGGVDSGLLAALAAQESGERLRTFSIGFEERSFDELDRARLVARRLGAEHHEAILGPDAVRSLPRIAAAFDEPYADSSALPVDAVAALTSAHVKVALSGEGGDELFGGYHTYSADLLAARLGGVARLARPLVERVPSSSRRVSLDYRARRFVRAAHLPPLERHHGWKEILAPAIRAQLLAPLHGGRTPSDPLDPLRARYGETAGAEPLARLQDADFAPYLSDDLLTKTDRMSMAHSVEVRVPFLDAHVAELALALPTSAKVRGLAKKRLLRSVAGTLLPRSIARGAKRGFSIPMAAWLRGDLLATARDLLAPDALRRGGVLAPEPVTRLLDEHVARRDDHSRALWGLLCFVLWQQQGQR
jgi:asparagine synthase (glutamine-hydrolysing)